MQDVTDNTPDLWRAALPRKDAQGHKYASGHAAIYGARELTGAARLAAEACARMGAGLVTVLCDAAAADIYRAALPAHIMVRGDTGWTDPRITARVLGCGGLPGGVTPALMKDWQGAAVLDAAAIPLWPHTAPAILTPHEGEFTRFFPGIAGERAGRAAQAAKATNAVLVLKGAHTVIAAPDGRVVLNRHAGPMLATAGTGDVLAGMIGGLTAQNMDPFLAACAAVWIYGDAALRFGTGLVAADLPGLLPAALQNLSPHTG